MTFGVPPDINYTPLEFPLSTNIPVMAPFWADIDTRGIGKIYYRMSNITRDVQMVNDIVANAFPAESDFTPDDVIIVTWQAVGYYDAKFNKVCTYNDVSVLMLVHKYTSIVYVLVQILPEI